MPEFLECPPQRQDVLHHSKKLGIMAYPGMASILNGSGCCPGGCTPDDSSYVNRRFCKTCGFPLF
jgi:hypothetical protein